jgi:hypothetical protein
MHRRRHRRHSEVAFSFDSFLDVVANVVGIIIRLILVVWVGARSYSTVKLLAARAPVAATPSAVAKEDPLPDDPMAAELERHRRELADLQARLLDQLRRLQIEQGEQQEAAHELAELSTQEENLDRESKSLAQSLAGQRSGTQVRALSLDELRQRSKQLLEQIRALEALPSQKQVLRYRTPVSRPVQSEELLFECRAGRVTFIDLQTFLTDIRNCIEDKGKQLRDTWSVNDVTAPSGPFRLRFTIERERGSMDVVAGIAPDAHGGYRYGLSEWVVEPLAAHRGEAIDAALATGSQFRRIVDGVDPGATVVTFWVYPDSFELYRRLRDYLYDRDVVVAGRPLLDGVPIASSRRGTVSRGQ